MSSRVRAVGVMVLEMAVTQIRSTVQHRHWSPPNQLCISDAQLLSVPFSSLLLFSFSFFALTHGSNLGVLSWTERMCGWAQGSVSTLAPSPLLFNPLILKRTKMENKRQTLPIHLFSTSSNSASYTFSLDLAEVQMQISGDTFQQQFYLGRAGRCYCPLAPKIWPKY